jgi:hypothetical protein
MKTRPRQTESSLLLSIDLASAKVLVSFARQRWAAARGGDGDAAARPLHPDECRRHQVRRSPRRSMN